METIKSFFSTYKNLIKLVIALTLFFSHSFVKYIPIELFNIDMQTATTTTVYALSIFSKLFLVVCLFLLYKKELIKNGKDFIKNFLDMSDIALKYWLIGLVIMGISNLLISTFSPVKVANNEAAVQSMIDTAPIFTLILTTIFAPIVEEIIFRKAFKNAIKRKIPYILTSGLVFGALHVVSLITTPFDYLYIIPYSALGIAFAIICYKTDNIFPSIFVHALHNGAITIVSIIQAGMMLL